jgi:hypothetical protein
MGQYRDKNGTAKGQKWDSIETKMGQQRDKNGTVSRQENIFVSILKIFCFFASLFHEFRGLTWLFLLNK